jgi:hypothetical protein
MRSLAQHLAPPGAQVYQTLVDHAEAQQRVDRVVDLHLRHAAHQSYAAAPPAFSEAVRKSLAEASIAPAASHPARDVTIPNQLAGATASSARGWRRSVQLTERQWRAALGGIGTLALAVIFGGVSVALDPSEVFSVLGMLSAVLLSALTVGHMLSTAVGAIMSSALLGCLAIALYAALCVLWVRLVRRPVEA